MTFDDLLMIAPAVINELATEFVRRGDECLNAEKTSQLTACTFLALRSVSLLCGMAPLLQPARRDSCDVLVRSLLESTDLLMHFRFDDEGTRKKIEYWFAGKTDNAWKADHNKCEEFMRRLGQGESQLATRWSAMTALSHPTVYAARRTWRVGLPDWRRGRALRKPWNRRLPTISHRSQNSSLSQRSTCRDGYRSDSTSTECQPRISSRENARPP
jgi:hypothetical protein